MDLPLMCLLVKAPISIVLFASSLCILSCVIIVMVSWRIALILRYHHITTRTSSTSQQPQSRPLCRTEALTEGVSNLSPRIAHQASINGNLLECAICSMEFVDGDVMRVLPHCGHGFHVKCIDRWLKCHSSCPFFRHILAMGRYQNFERL